MKKRKMRILLAIDDSRFSAAALEMLAAERSPATCVVRVLHVVEPLDVPYYPELTEPYPVSLRDIQAKRLEAARRFAAGAAARLRAAGFQAEAAVRTGSPRSLVVEVATQWRADLIVVGSHGRRGLARLLLGSVSDYVAHHAPCSVEIVRARKRKR
ncbi:MAG TPA: universal stress protein [Terriglobia bacterium]|nr:universal stress protein [Terriglobia bacterium]